MNECCMYATDSCFNCITIHTQLTQTKNRSSLCFSGTTSCMLELKWNEKEEKHKRLTRLLHFRWHHINLRCGKMCQWLMTELLVQRFSLSLYCSVNISLVLPLSTIGNVLQWLWLFIAHSFIFSLLRFERERKTATDSSLVSIDWSINHRSSSSNDWKQWQRRRSGVCVADTRKMVHMNGWRAQIGGREIVEFSRQ